MLRRLVFWGCVWIPLLGQADDWPWWRGPNGNNHANPQTEAPLRWDLRSGLNVVWKTPLPGRGHSTPIIVGDKVFMTTSDAKDQSQSVLRLNRSNGRLTDRWELHRGTLPRRIHPNNSHASPTPAFDGERLLVVFHTDQALWLTALSTSGRVLWKRKVCDFQPSAFKFGYGASPLVEEDVVIIAGEYDGEDSGLYALDRRTGKRVWKVPRPHNLNFASPIAATIAGQREVLLAGADMINAYDPQTGRELWRADAATEAICGTVVWDGRRVLVSGGNPVSGTWCVNGDGSGKLLWQNRVMCYEQSLLAADGFVYAIADGGVAYCWRSIDGVEMWKKRLFGGKVSASPLLVGNRLYIASEAGTIYVVAATPDRFDLLAENPSGDSLFASPVATDDRLYFRTGVGEGEDRQEYLVCVGQVSRSQPKPSQP
ncbi:MAG: PQQ-like beta-propeller repeat protein [Pirellulales bacterium]|nr:PQQ-like beta-propeller repeat protein [Pirellulales bacterium]